MRVPKTGESAWLGRFQDCHWALCPSCTTQFITTDDTPSELCLRCILASRVQDERAAIVAEHPALRRLL